MKNILLLSDVYLSDCGVWLGFYHSQKPDLPRQSGSSTGKIFCLFFVFGAVFPQRTPCPPPTKRFTLRATAGCIHVIGTISTSLLRRPPRQTKKQKTQARCYVEEEVNEDELLTQLPAEVEEVYHRHWSLVKTHKHCGKHLSVFTYFWAPYATPLWRQRLFETKCFKKNFSLFVIKTQRDQWIAVFSCLS